MMICVCVKNPWLRIHVLSSNVSTATTDSAADWPSDGRGIDGTRLTPPAATTAMPAADRQQQ